MTTVITVKIIAKSSLRTENPYNPIGNSPTEEAFGTKLLRRYLKQCDKSASTIGSNVYKSV